ncbi:MAG: hypothetical protein ABL903_16405 [Methylococcales bacterium]
MFFKLVDISKVKDKSWKNILPTSEGGYNQNIIAQSESVGGDVSGIEEIMKSISGCDQTTGALTYYQTQSVKPQVAESQTLDDASDKDKRITAFIALCKSMSTSAKVTNCLENARKDIESKGDDSNAQTKAG